MWKRKLNTSTQLSAILCRAISSTNFSSSISICRNYNSQLLNPSPLLSSRFDYFSSFPGGKHLRVLIGENENLFMRNEYFFCSTAENFHCWNCGADADKTTPFLFCQACRTVQPVDDSIDYFQIFGLGRKHKIEVDELEKKYKDWQKKLHPDLVHSKSQREREYAAEQSARVIDAYRTLTDPLLRAIYIVKLEGVHVDEEERITDLELLAEIMELREAVDEAEDTRALNEIQAQLQEKLRYWSNTFEDAYLSRNFEDALDSIRRMTYYRRANEEIIKKL